MECTDKFEDDHVDVNMNNFMTDGADNFIYNESRYGDDNNWW